MKAIWREELSVKKRIGLSTVSELCRIEIIGHHAGTVKSRTQILSTAAICS
jgi:hypothetical protein